MKNSIISDGHLTNNAALVGPSTCCRVEGFELEDVIGSGWLEAHVDSLAAVTVQK
jgi:hypothetical protein